MPVLAALTLSFLLCFSSYAIGQIIPSIGIVGTSSDSVDLSNVATIDEDGDLVDVGVRLDKTVITLSVEPLPGTCTSRVDRFELPTENGEVRVWLCPGGVGSTPLEIGGRASFNQVSDGSAARTCIDSDPDCTIAFVGSGGITVTVGGTLPNPTVTIAGSGAGSHHFAFGCNDTTASDPIFLRAAGYGAAVTCAASRTDSNGTYALSTRTGVVQRLFCLSSAAPGGSDAMVYTVQVNEVATALTCTISASATTCSDTTHTAAITAGQRIDLEMNPSADETLVHGCSMEVSF